MTQKSSISRDPTSADPEYLREGDVVGFVIPVSGVVTGISSPTQYFYQEGQQTDKSSTYFSGSMSISGVDTIVTKSTQNLKAGPWILSVFAVVDGQTQNVVTIPVIIKRKSER